MKSTISVARDIELWPEAGLERVASRLLLALQELREDQAYSGGAESLAMLDQAIRDRIAISGARLGDIPGRSLPALPVGASRNPWKTHKSPVREAAQLVDQLIDALGGVPDADQLLATRPVEVVIPRSLPRLV